MLIEEKETLTTRRLYFVKVFIVDNLLQYKLFPSTRAIIRRHVPNLRDLCLVLDAAGCGRLAETLRTPEGGAEVCGEANPDAEFWRREVERVLG